MDLTEKRLDSQVMYDGGFIEVLGYCVVADGRHEHARVYHPSRRRRDASHAGQRQSGDGAAVPIPCMANSSNCSTGGEDILVPLRSESCWKRPTTHGTRMDTPHHGHVGRASAIAEQVHGVFPRTRIEPCGSKLDDGAIPRSVRAFSG